MKTKVLQGDVSFGGSPVNGEYEFCGFRFPWIKGMKYHFDGKPGMRTMFIADKRERITISFEEGMQCLDQCTNLYPERRKVQAEYKESDKYLHQVKFLNGSGKKSEDLIYFHMEVMDEGGTLHICPGQMLTPVTRRQQEGPEPLLMRLLSGLRIIETEAM